MKCKEHKDEVDDNSDEQKCQFFRFEKVKVTKNSINEIDVIRVTQPSSVALSKQCVGMEINTVGSQSV